MFVTATDHSDYGIVLSHYCTIAYIGGPRGASGAPPWRHLFRAGWWHAGAELVVAAAG